MWKAIEGTNGMIEVSDKGEVRSLLRGEPYILKSNKDNKGYQRIRVTINRKKMSFKVHREVAKAFIPNPDNLPQVNHMDGNKSNNSVDNLEWCTNQQNVIHAVEIGLCGGDSVCEKMSVKDIDYSKHKTRTNGIRRKRTDWRNPNPKKAIVGYFNGQIKQFESIGEAEQFLNSRHITDVLKGKRQHVKGWRFEYRGEGER
jgi:hypothetical protein